MRIQLAAVSALAFIGLAACGTTEKDTTVVAPADSTVVVPADSNKTTTVITPGDPATGSGGSTVVVLPADN